MCMCACNKYMNKDLMNEWFLCMCASVVCVHVCVRACTV